MVIAQAINRTDQAVPLYPARAQPCAAVRADVLRNGNALRGAVNDQFHIQQTRGNRLGSNFVGNGNRMPKPCQNIPIAFGKGAIAWPCCTNRVKDSSRESSMVAEMHEQTHTPDLQDHELACL